MTMGRAVLAAILLLLARSPGAQAQVMLRATLSPGQETPPPSGVPASAGGTGSFTFHDEGMTLDFQVTVHDLSSTVIASHIHQAPPGTPGPIIIPLPELQGTTAALTADQVKALFDGGLYVNVHTANNPNGEIRGQILLAPPQCSCKSLNRGKFRSCVAHAIKKLDKNERRDDAIKALKRELKMASCGKKKGPRRAGCCLPQHPEDNIVVGHLCAPVSANACAKLGGTVAGASCFPTNPCTPPASPAGAFLDNAGGAL
jgi:Cu/Zn superoxide dismutase